MVCLLQKRWEPELLSSRLNQYSSLRNSRISKKSGVRKPRQF